MRKVSRREIVDRIVDNTTIEQMGNSEIFRVYTIGIGKGLKKQDVWEGTFPSHSRAMMFATIIAEDHLGWDIEFVKVVVRAY